MNNIPSPVQFIASMIIIIGSIELGNYIGRALRGREKNEKEGMISVISGTVLALLSFILAFTFGSVSDRFDARKALVRDEANQIGTAWLRTDFIPEPDRSAARKLLREYLDLRIITSGGVDNETVERAVARAITIQNQLWELGRSHAGKAMSTDLGALYFDSLNELIDTQGLRLAIGYRGQISPGFWISLYALLVLAMLSIGYHAAIIGSRRGIGSIILAFSFSLVISIISNLNHVHANHFTISRQPFLDLQSKIGSK